MIPNMRYADPLACPSCRGPIGGINRCPRCGFDLTSAEAIELWNIFTEADRLVFQSRGVAPAIEEGSPQTSTPRPSTKIAPPAVGVAPDAAPSRHVSAGAILLGLGALSLVVAALIFVSIAWGSLGIVGRATILAVITALWAMALVAALRRGLPGTSEALTFMVLAMLSVNVFASRSENLLGLKSVPWGLIALVWAGLLAAVGLFIVRASRVRLGRSMIIAEVVVAGSAWIAAPMVAEWLDGLMGRSDTFWALGIGGFVLAGVLALMVASHQKWGIWIVGVGVVAWMLMLSIWALDDYARGEGIWDWPTVAPLLSCAAVGLAVGFFWRRGRTAVFTYATLALALVATGTLSRVFEQAATPDVSQTTAPGLMAVTVAESLVLLVLLGLATLPGIWRPSARWSTGVAALVTLGSWLVWASITFVRIDDALDGTLRTIHSPARPWEMLAIGVSSVALMAVTLVVPVWRLRFTPTRVQPWLHLAAALVAVGGVATALVHANAPFLIHSLVIAIGIPLVGFFLRREAFGAQLLVLLPALLAVAVVPGDTLESFVAVLTVAVLLAGVVALRVSRDDVGAVPGVLAAVSTLFLVGAVPELMSVSGRPDWWSAVAVTGISAALLLVAMALDEWPWIRGGAEVALALLVLGALLDVLGDPVHVALVATIAGVACLVVALLQSNRRWQFGVTTFFFGIAWVARLLAWDVETIEAYSAPFAALALAAGTIAMVHRSDLGSWRALGPGLSLAFLPSLPFVLDEPASLRAALWGVLALLTMAAGVLRTWQSPFLVGSAAFAIVILANIGPVVLGLDRWILFGGVGLVLLALGVTWEKRVQDGKSLVARVARMG